MVVFQEMASELDMELCKYFGSCNSLMDELWVLVEVLRLT